MENLNSWPLDYRVSDTIKNCATIYDVKNLLKKTYAEHITAEFSHI
jgi:2-oxoglutarate dehydrogenase complex dehydrogenase (E1) component-like enzyme